MGSVVILGPRRFNAVDSTSAIPIQHVASPLSLHMVMILELLALSALAVGEWSQFRGPASDGQYAGPATATAWSETQTIAWKAPIAGLGWSSPVVADGKVLLTTAVPVGEGLSLRTLALDVQTGKTLWDREIRAVEKAPAIHAKNSHASPTPIIRDGAVFVHFGPLGMARLKLSDGAMQWTCFELDYPPLHGSGGSPILHGDKLVIVCDGSRDPFVAAIDTESGKVVWKTPRSVKARLTHSFVTPTVTQVAGEMQVLAPGPDHMAAYNLKTGVERWRVLAPGWSVVPQPAIGFGMVIYNHDYDNPELMAVKLGGQGDVTGTHVVWRLKRAAPSTPSPLLIGEDLYIVSDNGVASCVNARTGEAYWSARVGGNYSASPLLINDRILLLNETGLATWLKPGHTFTVLGTNELPGRTLATPACADGAIYLRTDEALYKVARLSEACES